jgi:hypothetical protein
MGYKTRFFFLEKKNLNAGTTVETITPQTQRHLGATGNFHKNSQRKNPRIYVHIWKVWSFIETCL